MKYRLQQKTNWHTIKMLFGGILLSGILFTGACSKSDTTGTTQHIEFGVLAPLTGAGASPGESAQAALALATRDINNYLSATGRNLDVKFNILDTKTDPDEALQQLEQLYSQGTRLVVGPYTSANSAAVLDYANQKGIVLLSPTSVASDLAIADDNLFRLIPSDGHQAAAIAALFEHDSINTIIPVVRNDVWGDGLIDNVMQVLDQQQGKTILNPIRYDPSSFDSGDIAAQVSASIGQALQQAPASHTAVYMLGFGEVTTILAAAAQEPNCTLVNWYGGTAYANNSSLVEDNTASVFALQQSLRCPSYAPDLAAKDLWEPINLELKTALGRVPESFALTTYDAAWLMTLAWLDCANPADLQLFKSTLMAVAEHYYGITGRTAFDANGDRKYGAYEFLGLAAPGNTFEWKAYGHFTNSTGQLVIY